jgi:hypothetical protein
MLVKAEVVGGSSSDPLGFGRVELRSSGLWDRSLRIPVVGNVALNEGDIVFVDISCGVDSPLVLGRSHDRSWRTHGSSFGSGFSLLWESVSSDGSSWSVAYTEGDEFWFENSSGLVLGACGDTIQFHDGSHGGLVNISSLNSFIQAVLRDLAVLGSGSNVSSWLSGDGLNLEDTTILH